ncbi:gcn5-related n-acetyltransferase [Stagonosporopsis vannaccii]|nr:gcn5-related n-acetyltransferase [Stagonosporopsis vannaccii]
MAAQPTPAHPATMEAQLKAQANPAIPTSAAAAPDSPLPAPIFTTARLVVRPLHPQDAPSMSHNANNLAVTKYMSLAFPSPYTLDSATTWISMNLTPPILNWGICLSSSPTTIIGGCGLKPGTDVQGHGAEVGFWIGEAFWGQGLVTEMLEGFVRWFFESEESRLASTEGGRWTRLWGGVFEGNAGSMRCFEKCGFAKEGVLRGAVEKDGRASDLHLFGLLKEEWEERVRR